MDHDVVGDRVADRAKSSQHRTSKCHESRADDEDVGASGAPQTEWVEGGGRSSPQELVPGVRVEDEDIGAGGALITWR